MRTPSLHPRYSRQQSYRADPAFQAAQEQKKTGVLVTTIGGGVELATAAVFGYIKLLCFAMAVSAGDEDGGGALCEHSGTVALGGVAVLGTSLAIGLPRWIGGVRDGRRIRDLYLRNLRRAPVGGYGQGSTGTLMTLRF